MKHETEDAIIKVVLAYKNGKNIQFKSKRFDGWSAATTPSWNFEACNYRIKPEPKEIWAVCKANNTFLSFETKVSAMAYAHAHLHLEDMHVCLFREVL